MKVYKTKTKPFSGTDFREVYRKAFHFYSRIKRKTKRRPYVRSAYFKKDKIFLELFWHHLHEKENFRDKIRRMKYFQPAVELIQKSKFDPESAENPNKSGEMLHRFYGITANSELFCVQIKEEKRSGKKWLMSVFPKK
ncbi:MAG TPA: hypothetical protein P5262_04600 [Candidatus Moranbacteria bacterium]|nr:hypothetical protein [Candidatus Moranbacteria bacterium]